MAENKQFLTCSFKLHAPSARKKEILDFVLDGYTAGAKTLLLWSRENIGVIEVEGVKRNKDGKSLGKWDANSIRSVVPSSGSWCMPISSALKEALIADVCSSLASYMELKKADANTGFPTAATSADEDRKAAYAFWADSANADEWLDLDTESQMRAKAGMRKRSVVRPVYFSRERDFALLLKPDMSALYAWLPILPADNTFLNEPFVCDGSLINISDGEPFKRKSKTAILVPVELGIRNGDYHWQFNEFVLKVLNGQASIQTAKLIRLDTDEEQTYKLNISFAFDCPEPYTPSAYLGIDRGILFCVAYGVIDMSGAVIAKGHFDDGMRQLQIDAGKQVKRKQQNAKGVSIKDYKRNARNEVLHKLVNHIIELAAKHQAAIVMEDLNIQVRGAFVKSAWQKIGKFIEYKAKLAGVPVHGEVFAAKTSLICIHCGGDIISHKRDGSPVVCSECGRSEHADEAAGVNIARRALYRKPAWEKRGGYRGFHRSFASLSCSAVATLPVFQAKNELRKSSDKHVKFGLFA